MYGNFVSSDILPRYMFFSTYKNKGLHDWDLRRGPPETNPPKVKKSEKCTWGFELIIKNDNDKK